MRHPAKRSAGFALISGLLMLVVITMLALSMFRSVGLQEKIAGNTREKQRSFQAAQSALQYAEWWLAQGNWGYGSTCTGTTVATTAMRVCSNPLASPADTSPASPWPVRSDYAPAAMSVAAGGGLNGGGDINYQASPALYISYIGVTATADAQLFQLNAVGYGGGASTVSVVQSIYAVSQSPIKDLGQ